MALLPHTHMPVLYKVARGSVTELPTTILTPKRAARVPLPGRSAPAEGASPVRAGLGPAAAECPAPRRGQLPRRIPGGWGGSHSSKPGQKQPETEAPRESRPVQGCGGLVPNLWCLRPTPGTASSSDRKSRSTAELPEQSAPPALSRRALSECQRGLPHHLTGPAAVLRRRPGPRIWPQKHPVVLTSHVEGKGKACQGPPVQQPQSQQGRKAGSQGLTDPQARGQHQGGHEHRPTSKPGAAGDTCG